MKNFDHPRGLKNGNYFLVIRDIFLRGSIILVRLLKFALATNQAGCP